MFGQGFWVDLAATGEGVDFSGRSGGVSMGYDSLDIPILLRYGFFNGLFGVMAGPHISFVPAPISGFANYSISFSHGHDRAPPRVDNRRLFGATAGVFGLLPAGPGRIVADLRFVFDFNAIQIQVAGNSYNIMRRRVPIISLGYELSF